MISLGGTGRGLHGAAEKCQPDCMTRRATVVIEKDEHGFYAWRPELEGRHSQCLTLEEAMANIEDAAELCIETSPRDAANR
jgi:predicted RNase H-like HicB family nuclease